MFAFVEPFILLLVIMDPVLSLAALLGLERKNNAAELRKTALQSVFVATLVFVAFAVFGDSVLSVLGVNLESFRAAGGIILILMGIQLSLGISFPKEKEEPEDIAVVIGTPLISGPATITTTIILVKDFGLHTTLLAGGASLLVVLASLLLAGNIRKLIGRAGLRVLSTMMGIVTMAWGMQFLLASF
ncbi:MAG: MarC family protein [Candidatus Micrarchaeia archaeon]